MAQLNAGDVLAIVGGDVTRKPVLQCIGEMREARREKWREKKQREASSIACSRERLFALHSSSLLASPTRSLPRSASCVLYDRSFLPSVSKKRGRVRVDEERGREKERNRRVERRESFSSLSPSFFALSSSHFPLSLRFGLLSAARGEKVALTCSGKRGERARVQRPEGSFERGSRWLSLSQLSIARRRASRARARFARRAVRPQLEKKLTHSLPLARPQSRPTIPNKQKQASSRWPAPPLPEERPRPPRPSATASASPTGSTGEKKLESCEFFFSL